jgi:uncharacterized GH25 family protein
VLASNQAVAEAGGKTTVYLSWGHRLPVDDLVDTATLERYDLVSPAGQSAALKSSDRSMQANVVELKDAGVYQVAVSRKPSLITYVLDGEGKPQMKRGPKSDHAKDKIDSSMKSLQFAKALIVVGKPSGEPPAPLGQAAEIVPLDGPAKWSSGAALRFRVLIDGKPLPSTEVVARYVGFKPDNAWNYATTSDRKGEFSVKPSQAGTWVLKVRARRPAPAKARDQYDTESYTATLSLDVHP